MLNIKQYEMIRFLSLSKTYVIADTLARQVNISEASNVMWKRSMKY